MLRPNSRSSREFKRARARDRLRDLKATIGAAGCDRPSSARSPSGPAAVDLLRQRADRHRVRRRCGAVPPRVARRGPPRVRLARFRPPHRRPLLARARAAPRPKLGLEQQQDARPLRCRGRAARRLRRRRAPAKTDVDLSLFRKPSSPPQRSSRSRSSSSMFRCSSSSRCTSRTSCTSPRLPGFFLPLCCSRSRAPLRTILDARPCASCWRRHGARRLALVLMRLSVVG